MMIFFTAWQKPDAPKILETGLGVRQRAAVVHERHVRGDARLAAVVPELQRTRARNREHSAIGAEGQGYDVAVDPGLGHDFISLNIPYDYMAAETARGHDVGVARVELDAPWGARVSSEHPNYLFSFEAGNFGCVVSVCGREVIVAIASHISPETEGKRYRAFCSWFSKLNHVHDWISLEHDTIQRFLPNRWWANMIIFFILDHTSPGGNLRELKNMAPWRC